MAALRVSAPVSSGLRASSCSARPILPVRRPVRAVVVRAEAGKSEQSVFEFSKVAALTTAASELMFAGHANAATEIAQLAAGDNRFGIIATLFVPVVGWVLFNILQPAQNQLAKMADEIPSSGTTKKRRGVAAAVGLGAAASMLLADQADAASELAQLAAGDNRFGTIATLFVPVVGWVLFNILQPAQNQLAKMADEIPAPSTGTFKKKRGVAAAVGLGAAASMLFVEQADAATELAQLAASDNRFGIIATLFVPVVGWVLFNILQPAQNQLAKMTDEIPAPKKAAIKSATKKIFNKKK